jgi:hypothetical protein
MDMIEYTIQLFLNDLCLLYELDGFTQSFKEHLLTGVRILIRVARFFLVQTYQNGKNKPKDPKLGIPNNHKLYQMAGNYSKWL